MNTDEFFWMSTDAPSRTTVEGHPLAPLELDGADHASGRLDALDRGRAAQRTVEGGEPGHEGVGEALGATRGVPMSPTRCWSRCRRSTTPPSAGTRCRSRLRRYPAYVSQRG